MRESIKKDLLKKRKIIIDDDDDDDDDEDKNNNNANFKSNSKSKSKTSHNDDDDDEDNEDEDDNDDDDNDDDDEDDESPLNHWQVNALIDQQNDINPFAIVNKSYGREEAFAIYIEYLAKSLVDKDFVAKVHRESTSSVSSSSSKFASTARQTENLISTCRESLLGSVWAPKFLEQVQNRPFYMRNVCDHDEDERCAACNRTSKRARSAYQIHLYGTSYNARRVWDTGRWDKEMPAALFIYNDDEEGVNDDDDEDDDNDDSDDDDDEEEDDDDSFIVNDDEDEDEDYDNDKKRKKKKKKLTCAKPWWLQALPAGLTKGRESRWYLAGHCTFRTQMYHTLLHYKFRLLLKIREKLKKNGNVDVLLNNDNFIKSEVNRFTKLINDAGKSFGGDEFMRDAWDHHSETRQLTLSMPSGSSKKASSSSSSSSSKKYNTPGASMVSWLNKDKNTNSSHGSRSSIVIDNVSNDANIFRVDI